MPKAATRVKSPTARPSEPRNSAAIASSAKPVGIPESVEVLHGSLKAVATKPPERLLGAVRKNHYRKSDPQNESHDSTVIEVFP